jgi:hypothetical protein
MEKSHLLGIALAATQAFAATESSAVTTTYADRTAFEAAAGTTITYGFDASVSTTISHDFGAFTLVSGPGNGSRQPDFSVFGGTLNLDENFSDPDYGGSDPLFTLTFDGPVMALGFDYDNSDEDNLELLINGAVFTASTPTSIGFFGIITDTPFSFVELLDDAGGGGNLWPISLDNLTYAETTMVPLPAAVWLFGSGLLGVIGIARRKKAA